MDGIKMKSTETDDKNKAELRDCCRWLDIYEKTTVDDGDGCKERNGERESGG